MPNLIYVKPGGWLPYHEDRARLASHASPFTYGDAGSAPEEKDQSTWMPIEDQGQQGSCQGFDLSSCVELVNVQDGNEFAQLSPAAAYYMSQRIDGISGDRGSTIEGGIRLAMTDGIPLLSFWPYPQNYNPRIPAGYADAPKWRISGHVQIKDYDQAINHLATRGPLSLGVMWSNALDEQVARNGIIERFVPGAGGHAICISGYVRKTFSGTTLTKPALLSPQSWGNYGKDGWYLWSYDAFQKALDHQWSVCEGLYGIIIPGEPVMPVYGDYS